jgi:hypothetical protein
MEITVHEGQWIASIEQLMETATIDDIFLLPSIIHLHAFEEVNKKFFPDKTFRAKLNF